MKTRTKVGALVLSLAMPFMVMTATSGAASTGAALVPTLQNLTLAVATINWCNAIPKLQSSLGALKALQKQGPLVKLAEALLQTTIDFISKNYNCGVS